MENVILDAVFGELVLDEKYGDWVGEVEIQPNLKIPFNISVFREVLLEEIDQFRETFQNVLRNEPQARKFAADELLQVHNDNWCDPEDAITEQEFCQRIKPTRIVIEEDRSVEIYYDDDDLFLRHVIVVWIDAAGNFGDAGIAG